MSSGQHRHKKQLQTEYGGFNDLTSFRAETGLQVGDISDVDALKVINEDMREQKRIADTERNKANQERDRLRADAESTRASKSSIERELDAEKAKRKLTDALLYPLGSPSTMADYYIKERFKQDIKDDLLREQRNRKYELEREKELAKLWKPERKPRARSRSKPRSKSRSKPKSKSRSKSKGKSKK